MNAELPVVLLVAAPIRLRGTSAYTMRLAKRLPAHGFQRIVVTADASTVPLERQKELSIVENSYLDSAFFGPLAALVTARDVARQKPVLVHIQSRMAMPAGLAIARRLKLPWLVTIHDYLAENEVLPFDRRLGRRLIAVSESVRDALLKHRAAPSELVRMIYSGVPVHAERDNSGLLDPQRVPVIGAAGALEGPKGMSFFIEAARKVLDTGRDVEFLIAGTGPEEALLRKQVKSLKLTEHLTFITNLSSFETPLKAMDIFVLPALKQGLGTIMLEAMSLGRPVIATNVGGVATIVEDGRTGLIVPPANSDRLAERMIELLNDPLRARRIADAACQQVAERFNIDQMVTETAAEYRSVLSLGNL